MHPGIRPYFETTAHVNFSYRYFLFLLLCYPYQVNMRTCSTKIGGEVLAHLQAGMHKLTS